jgi:hypothetical protein
MSEIKIVMLIAFWIVSVGSLSWLAFFAGKSLAIIDSLGAVADSFTGLSDEQEAGACAFSDNVMANMKKRGLIP